MQMRVDILSIASRRVERVDSALSRRRARGGGGDEPESVGG